MQSVGTHQQTSTKQADTIVHLLVVYCHMQRRSFLKSSSLVATAGLIGVAGCGAPENGGGDGTTPGNGAVTTAAETTAGAGGETTEMETTAGEETTEAETTEETTEGETTDGAETGTAGGGTTTVEMVTEGSEYYFDPIGLYVEPGTTVTWTNESGAHSSTAYADGNGGASVTRIPEGAEPWDSGTMSEQGATFEHTFETEGTYDYFCLPHETLGMVARIVVGEPGGPAEGSMPPDGDVPESQTIVDQGTVSYSEFSQ